MNHDMIYKWEAMDIVRGNGAMEVAIENIPSRYKTSKWIRDKKRFGDDSVRCRLCGAVLEGDDLKWRTNNFCYHCGADMEVWKLG